MILLTHIWVFDLLPTMPECPLLGLSTGAKIKNLNFLVLI